ncbi:MAG: hypothetical protein RXR41_04725 [Candidatus Marsarchaeota archaeon]
MKSVIKLDLDSLVPCFTCPFTMECEEGATHSPEKCTVLTMWLNRQEKSGVVG